MRFARLHRAFTLLELLAVIAIIGILAAMVAPSLYQWRKGDAIAAGSRQMLDAVSRARQLAISQRTTVYMIFVPTNFWEQPFFSSAALEPADRQAITNLASRQLVGYNYLALRAVGDQPGQGVPRYLSTWQALPEGTFVGLEKFQPPWSPPVFAPTNAAGTAGIRIAGFFVTDRLPFPRAETRPPYPLVPYIAFNYLGQLTSFESDPEPITIRPAEYIPVAHARIAHSVDRQTGLALLEGPWIEEDVPPGTRIRTYQFIEIDALTGRARLIKRAAQ